MRRFQKRVFGLALTMLGDPETARDVTQETFVRAWRYAAGDDPRRGEVAIWLLTIARNAAHNSRRLRRDEPLEPQQIVSMERFGGDDPADRAAATQEREQLLEAIAVLPEQQRRALVFAAFGGRTAREISGIEGIRWARPRPACDRPCCGSAPSWVIPGREGIGLARAPGWGEGPVRTASAVEVRAGYVDRAIGGQRNARGQSPSSNRIWSLKLSSPDALVASAQALPCTTQPGRSSRRTRARRVRSLGAAAPGGSRTRAISAGGK